MDRLHERVIALHQNSAAAAAIQDITVHPDGDPDAIARKYSFAGLHDLLHYVESDEALQQSLEMGLKTAERSASVSKALHIATEALPEVAQSLVDGIRNPRNSLHSKALATRALLDLREALLISRDSTQAPTGRRSALAMLVVNVSANDVNVTEVKPEFAGFDEPADAIDMPSSNILESQANSTHLVGG